jgi:hypothetical protein
MCSNCIVSAAVNSKILAPAAAFGRATASPFGSEDEIGMLNLIDAASRKVQQPVLDLTASVWRWIDLPVR